MTKVYNDRITNQFISYNLNSLSADQLTKTSTIEFNAEGNYTEFFADSVFDEGAQARIAHNTANSISYSLETPE